MFLWLLLAETDLNIGTASTTFDVTVNVLHFAMYSF